MAGHKKDKILVSDVSKTSHTEDEVVSMLKEYYTEYKAYDNSATGDYNKYFNYADELYVKYGFTSRSRWVYGYTASPLVQEAYHMIKLAKIDKIEKRIFNGMPKHQINYAIYSIKSLGASDEYLDELRYRYERLDIERERVRLLAESTKVPVSTPTDISIGFSDEMSE